MTDSCRGCIAHHCEEVCPVGAIGFDRHQKAYIDKDKCVNCGKCAGVCPYSAIVNRKRPCEAACKIGAIGKDEQQNASIDNNKCISCGACVYQCPFGAIMDKSYLLEVIRLIRESKNNEAYRLYAVVAPSISSQFSYAKLGQVISAIKKLGFYKVVEAALGADMVAMAESKELMEKGFLTTSCCPAFVTYVRKNYPELMEHVSHNLAYGGDFPAHQGGGRQRSGCIYRAVHGKKVGDSPKGVQPYVDSVLTFEGAAGAD